MPAAGQSLRGRALDRAAAGSKQARACRELLHISRPGASAASQNTNSDVWSTGCLVPFVLYIQVVAVAVAVAVAVLLLCSILGG